MVGANTPEVRLALKELEFATEALPWSTYRMGSEITPEKRKATKSPATTNTNKVVTIPTWTKSRSDSSAGTFWMGSKSGK